MMSYCDSFLPIHDRVQDMVRADWHLVGVERLRKAAAVSGGILNPLRYAPLRIHWTKEPI